MARVNAPDPLAIAALVHIHIAVIGPELTLFTAPAPTCGQHRELCPALPPPSGRAELDTARMAGVLSSCPLPSRAPPPATVTSTAARGAAGSAPPRAAVHGRERASARQRPRQAA